MKLIFMLLIITIWAYKAPTKVNITTLLVHIILTLTAWSHVSSPVLTYHTKPAFLPHFQYSAGTLFFGILKQASFKCLCFPEIFDLWYWVCLCF